MRARHKAWMAHSCKIPLECVRLLRSKPLVDLPGEPIGRIETKESCTLAELKISKLELWIGRSID